ncbi:MAG: DEAD/DEAH box helicase, partial [candidate division Zixibacteria bacterium]|nr:DEAD/DEAH box helicase [candidate division Zixibacteria bacterium]
MNLEQLIDLLKNDRAINKNITHWKSISARAPKYIDFPDYLDKRLTATLNKKGIEQLYTHQLETIEAVREGHDTVVVTPTASGKTLCYNIPVISEILKNPSARALYLFPTKALSQ